MRASSETTPNQNPLAPRKLSRRAKPRRSAAPVVLGDPRIKVGLQLVDGVIDLFTERHPIELIQDGAMERSQIPLVCGLLVLVRL